MFGVVRKEVSNMDERTMCTGWYSESRKRTEPGKATSCKELTKDGQKESGNQETVEVWVEMESSRDDIGAFGRAGL